MTERFFSVTLRSGGTALLAGANVAALSQGRDNVFRVFLAGDSTPFELTESSFNSLRYYLADHCTVNCK